jgi:hypothetical protein
VLLKWRGNVSFVFLTSLQVNARERVNIVVITVLKGIVTAKQIEDEFTRILSDKWRWITRRVADNMFIVRFSYAQLI